MRGEKGMMYPMRRGKNDIHLLLTFTETQRRREKLLNSKWLKCKLGDNR